MQTLKNQAPAMGGWPELDIDLVLRDSTKLGTCSVPESHYTVPMGGF